MYGLKDDLLKAIVQLAERHGLRQLILFGSRARGDYKERSDIDLAAEGGDITAFALDVDEKIPTLLMFDVVDLSMPIQVELRQNITRDGKVLYEKI